MSHTSHLSLEHLKKQAKQLLKDFHRGESAAFRMFQSIARYSSLSRQEFFKADLKLHDAQYAVALHYGFASWQQLSAHCQNQTKKLAMYEELNAQFHQLQTISNRAVQRLLRQVDTRVLSRALQGAAAPLQAKIFRNMSARAGELLRSEMQADTKLPEEQIHRAREIILENCRRLEKAGEISTRPEEDTEVKPSAPIRSLKKGQASQWTSEELMEFFTQLADKARAEGLLMLESDAELIDDEILKKGLELVIDGTAPRLVDEAMHTRLKKILEDYRRKYEGVISAVLAIQQGDHPQIIREKLDAAL